jgi:hypothetical protein
LAKSKRNYPRLPEASEGLQVNFCKNPLCVNFGVPAMQFAGETRGKRINDDYKIQGGKHAGQTLVCKACGESPSLKSNRAITEERTRLLGLLAVAYGPSCADEACANHAVRVGEDPEAYARYGRSRHGAPRFKCRAYGKVLSIGKATARQKKSHKNRLILLLLMNKTPFNRICEIAEVAPGTVYAKIDFLYRQCVLYAAERERKFLEGLDLGHLEIAVDRQEYLFNWTTQQCPI